MKKILILFGLLIVIIILVSCINNSKEIQINETTETYKVDFHTDSKKTVHSIDVDINHDINQTINIEIGNSSYILSGNGYKTIRNLDYYSNSIIIVINSNHAIGKVSISVSFNCL